MLTVAEKAVALAVVLAIDVALLSFGGAILAGAAAVASLPFTVSILVR